jgi:ubiquinone/menaquinone biosynthesis C-methylase UbiE
MTGKSDWQGKTGEGWAAQWQRTDRSFAGVTEKLLARSREFPFRGALDIGCGAGELSLALGRGHPQARVIGVDVSPQLIDVARERGANLANVGFELADAAQWRPSDGFSPELLISRHGVMFFDDPTAAFANLAAVAAPRANLLFSCFRDRRESEFFTKIGKLFAAPSEVPDPLAPGPFAFADREHVTAILARAGWRDVAFEPLDFAMVAGAGEDPVEDAMTYFKTIGPAAVALREMADGDRAETLGRIREVVTAHCRNGLVALGAGVWIVTAVRA